MKYVGIDIGGTSIKGGFVSENGEILNRFGFPIDKNASQEELIQRLGDLINEQISRVNALLLGLIKFYKKQLKDMP